MSTRAAPSARSTTCTNALGRSGRAAQKLLARLKQADNLVKLTFSKGASLRDPSGLFNSSLDGKVRRAIDIIVLRTR